MPAVAVVGEGARTRLASPIAAKGFRPFFLLAASYAVGIVPLWLTIVAGRVSASPYLEPSVWHAHEMLFGFAGAVIAGFLLTAVGNWTQRETLSGPPLLALAGLWLLGRGAMLLATALPWGLAALVDLLFLPVLIVVLARPLIAAKSRRNFVMLAVLGALWLGNLAVHLQALGFLPSGSAAHACLVALDVVVLLMLVIAGRVIPMFTRNALGASEIRSLPTLDGVTAIAMAAVVVLDLSAPETLVAKLAAGAVGVVALVRARHWGALRSFRDPLLWVLHVGYAWLVVGLLLRAALALYPLAPTTLATHALTVGALGSLTIGMMARVSLGHTGRPLVASRAVEWAFSLMFSAGLARVVLPSIAPESYWASLVLAGSLWSMAFAMFLLAYAPALARPRVDGKPG